MSGIRENEMDVETLMARVCENLNRRGLGGWATFEDTTIAPLPNTSSTSLDKEQRLSLLRLLQDPEPQGLIAARGGVVIRQAKRLIRRILAPYHRAIFARQAEFNSNVVVLMTELLQTLQTVSTKHADVIETLRSRLETLQAEQEVTITQLRSQLEKLTSGLDDKHGDPLGRLEELRQEVTLQKRRLELILLELRKKIGDERESLKKVASLKDRLMDHSYILFENKHRLSREEIRKRQEIYVPLFKARVAFGEDAETSKPSVMLDVGCGRGEFLELLRENGIPAKGIDLNEDMVYFCKERGLDVEQANALDYLQSLPEDSLGGIIACQVIEHLPVNEMIEFIKLSYQKMEKGGKAVFETVNPLSLVVSATHFYMDLSHVRQVHPAALQFLAEAIGFRNAEIQFLAPHPDELKLQLLPGNDPASQYLNDNFKRLNDILFGYRDYALICEK